jgi:hypothetical protein
MELPRELVLSRIIAEWFNAHWEHTDGKFSTSNPLAYNSDSVVVNAELLWQHFRYYLHATARSACCPSKELFYHALRCSGIKMKHVKNRYVGSIRLAAAVRALPKTAGMCTEPVWHPGGAHIGLKQS